MLCIQIADIFIKFYVCRNSNRFLGFHVPSKQSFRARCYVCWYLKIGYRGDHYGDKCFRNTRCARIIIYVHKNVKTRDS